MSQTQKQLFVRLNNGLASNIKSFSAFDLPFYADHLANVKYENFRLHILLKYHDFILSGLKAPTVNIPIPPSFNINFNREISEIGLIHSAWYERIVAEIQALRSRKATLLEGVLSAADIDSYFKNQATPQVNLNGLGVIDLRSILDRFKRVIISRMADMDIISTEMNLAVTNIERNSDRIYRDILELTFPGFAQMIDDEFGSYRKTLLESLRQYYRYLCEISLSKTHHTYLELLYGDITLLVQSLTEVLQIEGLSTQSIPLPVPDLCKFLLVPPTVEANNNSSPTIVVKEDFIIIRKRRDYSLLNFKLDSYYRNEQKFIVKKQGTITDSYVNYEEVRFAIERNGRFGGIEARNLPSTNGLVIIDRSPVEWFLHSYWIDLKNQQDQYVVRIHKISSEQSVNLSASYSSATYSSYSSTTTTTSSVYPFYYEASTSLLGDRETKASSSDSSLERLTASQIFGQSTYTATASSSFGKINFQP